MEDAGGPGLEFHQFDHIDMPLDEVYIYIYITTESAPIRSPRRQDVCLSSTLSAMLCPFNSVFRILDIMFWESLQTRKEL